MIRFTLPIPPSTNSLFIQRGKVRVKTAAYTKWRNTCLAHMAVLQRKGWFDGVILPLTGKAEVNIAVGKCRKSRDLDNMAKPILDLLVSYGILKDDNLNHVEGVHIIDATQSLNLVVPECVSISIFHHDRDSIEAHLDYLITKAGLDKVLSHVLSRKVETAEAVNPRALGTNPRAIGVSPRQMRKGAK